MSVLGLIVSSYATERDALLRDLAGLGVEILVADSGARALEMVAEADYAFVLCSLELDDMEGLELSRLIQGDRHKRHIPVMLLAPQQRVAQIEHRALEAGAVDCVGAPWRGGVLRAKARRYVAIAAAWNELVNRGERLERSNVEFREFALATAHDVLGPLHTIAGYARLSVDEPAEAAASGEKILATAQRLERMLTAMLDYAQVGRPTAREPVDLEHCVREVLDGLQRSLAVSGAAVQLGPLPVVRGSETQLARVFQNVIGNAVKYARPGVPPQIAIAARAEREHVCISIRDNGRGFSMEKVEEVFRPFRRLVGVDEAPGAGVGMALSRRIAENHGGTLFASSVLGEGSTFRLTLPLTPLEAARHARRVRAIESRDAELQSDASAPEPAGEESAVRGPGDRSSGVRSVERVLVVDDDELERELVVRQLARTFLTSEASSAEEALERLQEEHFHAVVSDYNMGDRDGAWLLSRVQESYPEVRRVLLSTLPDERCRAALASNVAHRLLSKPADRRSQCDALSGSARATNEHDVRRAEWGT